MLNIFRQTVIALLLVIGTVAGWVVFVPSATGVLDQVGLLDMLGIERTDTANAAAGDDRGSEATRVIVAPVALREVADRITSIGDGQAVRIVTVRSETQGRITEVGVTSGERVTAGQVVVRLEDRGEQIALERARVALTDAQSDLERLSQLANTGAVTSVRRQEAELAARTAELEVEQAEYDLDQRTVRAPIAGRIGLIDLEIGERVSAEDALATITDRSQILIDFRVPERVISNLEVGLPIDVTPLARRGTVLTGTLSAIDTVVDRASRTLRVQGRLENPDDALRSGMAFSVAMEFPGDTLPAIDPLALQWSRAGSFVWVVRDGAAARVPVTIVQRDTDAVLVDAALSENDAVITEGHQTLRPGAAVEITNADDVTESARSAAVGGRRKL